MNSRATLGIQWHELLALAHGGKLAGDKRERPVKVPAALYRPVAEGDGRPIFVIGQLGQSLDGRVATVAAHSHYINGPQSIVHLHRLRALVDAVVIGVGTALADDPQLTVRQVVGPDPARVVVDPHGRLPAKARVLADDGLPIFVVRTISCPPAGRATPLVLEAPDGRIDPRAIVAALAERGFRRLLIEGGAHTVSAFLAAGALDRLHVAVAPLIIGSGLPGISLPEIDRLDHALRPEVATYPLGDDLLFDCRFPRSANP